MLSGCWCYTVLNVQMSNDHKSEDTKENFYKEMCQFPKHCIINIMLGNFSVKSGKDIIFNDNWE
jgi:hypothetical protein